MTHPEVTAGKRLIFRGTDRNKGRHISVSPLNSSMLHLSYGRIVLDRETPRARFETGSSEVALICLSGQCRVRLSRAESYDLGQYDALYVPRDRAIDVSSESGVDLVECSAEVEQKYPVQLIRYADVQATPALKFMTGGENARRELNILIGNHVKAGRLLAGFTRSAPGNWASWPPHEQTQLLEEVYVYFDMPAPSFGVQLVYTKPDEPEFVGIVRSGDAVPMPSGYRPNVAVPGHSINFVWLMAAHREGVDRVYGVKNVQPEFKTTASGLEGALR
ncbi:MAG TPA: 5-deoxy-glucuronate isomerase [Polyangiaceae bacterium]|nr:5-deoxy-glucuronate isomerase [Polyangiaceae bacterium]